MNDESVTPKQSQSLRSQIWDWILERGDATLAIFIAITALAGVAFTDTSKGRLIPAAVVCGFTVAQGVLRDKRKDRIDVLKADLTQAGEKERQWLSREEGYQEEIRRLHHDSKAAITAWITAVAKACDLNHCHRLSVFVVGRDDKHMYLIARYSSHSQFNVVSNKPYSNDGAINMAWKTGRHIGELLPDNRGNKNVRKRYAGAVERIYGVKRTRMEKSIMSPLHYASWRLDISDHPCPAVVVFESQIDSRDKIDNIEAQLLNQASKPMRQLAVSVRQYEITMRENAKVDMEGGDI